MKKIGLFTITTFLAGLFFTAAAFGADVIMDRSMAGQELIETDLHSAERFIGTEVRDLNGQQIGEVKDVVFDFDRGIGFAVVETDEMTEIDEKYLVPLSAFSSTHEGDFVTLSVDREQLAAAPEREREMTGETYGRMLYEYYGISYPWSDLPGDVPIKQENVPGSNLTYPGHRDVVPERK